MVESIKELRRICQNKWQNFSRGYPPWEIFDRAISIYFTKFFLIIGISANQVTFINIIMGIIGCFYLAIGPSLYAVIGSLILRFWSILDCVDGEIARYNRIDSVTGQYVDRLNNMIIEPLIFMSLSFRLYFIYNEISIFIFGFLASISALQIKLALFEGYASAIDVYLTRRNDGINSEHNKEERENVQEVLIHLSSLSSRFYAIIQIFLPGCIGMLWLLLAASIINYVLPQITIFYISFNSLYLILIIYGILGSIGWMALVIIVLRKNIPEKIYKILDSK